MAILFEWYETPVPNNETDETEKTTIHADAHVQAAEKQRLVGHGAVYVARADFQMIGKRRAAGVVEVNHAFFTSFTRDPQGTQIVVKIGQVDSAQFGNTHSAVEKQGQNRIVTNAVRRVGVMPYRFEQTERLVQRQHFRQGFLRFRGVDVNGWVFGQVVPLGNQILIQGTDGSKLACPRGPVVVPNRPRIEQELVDVVLRDFPQAIQTDRADIHLIELGGFKRNIEVAGDEKAEEGAQIDFFKDVKSELKKVRWPLKKEMITYSIATLVFMAILGLFFIATDLIIDFLVVGIHLLYHYQFLFLHFGS